MTETPDMNQKFARDPHVEEAKNHMRAARYSMRKSIESLLPQGYVEHSRAARKEFLLAMRSLVDAAINRIEDKPGNM